METALLGKTPLTTSFQLMLNSRRFVYCAAAFFIKTSNCTDGGQSQYYHKANQGVTKELARKLMNEEIELIVLDSADDAMHSSMHGEAIHVAVANYSQSKETVRNQAQEIGKHIRSDSVHWLRSNHWDSFIKGDLRDLQDERDGIPPIPPIPLGRLIDKLCGVADQFSGCTVPTNIQLAHYEKEGRYVVCYTLYTIYYTLYTLHYTLYTIHYRSTEITSPNPS